MQLDHFQVALYLLQPSPLPEPVDQQIHRNRILSSLPLLKLDNYLGREYLHCTLKSVLAVQPSSVFAFDASPNSKSCTRTFHTQNGTHTDKRGTVKVIITALRSQSTVRNMKIDAVSN